MTIEIYPVTIFFGVLAQSDEGQGRPKGQTSESDCTSGTKGWAPDHAGNSVSFLSN